MIGTTVSHYRILELLGGGGKGVVYKAQDLRLQRFVALKFLSGTVGEGDEEVQRFLREARAASAIEHPNLCTVYEIDEADEGQLFIAMAFSEGETLKAKIERGPLELELAVDLAVQIAGGLHRAHERGIVHRDIKPANLIVTPEGQVKIVDFGIAHLSGQTRLTRAGSMVGTAAYMSPEQLRSAPADPRMDIWALGVVLYEMVTGQAPFRGEDRVLLYSILNRHPAPMSTLRPGVPSALERIVSRALAKNPRDRYPSLEEMRVDLTSLRWSSAPTEERDATPTPSSASRSPSVDTPPTAPGLPAPSSPAAPAASPEGAEPAAGPRPEGPRLDRSISHYRIGQRLGGGGMGVVYKAEDTLLQRTVALKLLPRRLTLDPEGKERFLQEARTASALDHPNLCTIYEVGETADGQLFLAMPYYDGETLRKRLERGRLPVIEAVDIAAQVAQGLARVHRRGIVHRDIKPANLMVTGDGIAKILDFGIAKLVREAVAAPAEAGLGTPAYMSPEQASGGEVDPRSDLWSLGVVLYEMLTGRRPFRGDQEQAVIYALLHDEPEPVARLRPDVPAELDRILGRLLVKDPEKRYATADEAFLDLRRLFGESSGAYFPPPPVEAARPGRRTGWAAATAGVAVAAALGLFLAFRPPPGNPFFQANSLQLTRQPGREEQPSLAPDGSGFVYVRHDGGDLDIFYQSLNGGGPPVNLTAGSPVLDAQPAFSPDGKTIAFVSDRDGGGIFLMDRQGGSVRPLTDHGANPAWSPDGLDIAYATEAVLNPGARSTVSELRRVNVETGEQRQIDTDDAVQPSWSPNGQRIAYWGNKDGRRILWTIPAAGGEAVAVVQDEYLNWNPVWSPDGRYLFFASDRSGSMNLWYVPIDQETGKVRGKLEPVRAPAPSCAWLSFSRDGRQILYAADETQAHLVKVPLDPATARVSGPLVQITEGAQPVRSGTVSPDGEWIVFDSAIPKEDLFLVRVDGTGLRQLTDDAAKDRSPRWFPDGSRIVFFSNRSGKFEAWSLRPQDGHLEQLTDFDKPVLDAFVSPDQRLLSCRFDLGSEAPVLVDLQVPLAQRVPMPLPMAVPPTESFAVYDWSLDRLWLAGHSSSGLLLYSFAARRLSLLGQPTGHQPVWLDGDRKLLFLDQDRIRAIDLQSRSAWDVLVPREHWFYGKVSLSPDGRNLYAVRGQREGNIWLLKID